VDVVDGLMEDGANAAQDVTRERRARVYFMVAKEFVFLGGGGVISQKDYN